VFGHILSLAGRVREQTQRQRGPKVYSLHAPEVECIGKGKAHRPVTHVKSLPGNPYDGHTLETDIPDTEALIGNIIERTLCVGEELEKRSTRRSKNHLSA
jgi:transposase, IS5 family